MILLKVVKKCVWGVACKKGSRDGIKAGEIGRGWRCGGVGSLGKKGGGVSLEGVVLGGYG